MPVLYYLPFAVISSLSDLINHCTYLPAILTSVSEPNYIYSCKFWCCLWQDWQCSSTLQSVNLVRWIDVSRWATVTVELQYTSARACVAHNLSAEHHFGVYAMVLAVGLSQTDWYLFCKKYLTMILTSLARQEYKYICIWIIKIKVKINYNRSLKNVNVTSGYKISLEADIKVVM